MKLFNIVLIAFWLTFSIYAAHAYKFNFDASESRIEVLTSHIFNTMAQNTDFGWTDMECEILWDKAKNLAKQANIPSGRK